MAADYVADVEHSPYLALYEQPALRALLPPVAGRRVLDAGCGAGRHSRLARRAGRRSRRPRREPGDAGPRPCPCPRRHVRRRRSGRAARPRGRRVRRRDRQPRPALPPGLGPDAPRAAPRPAPAAACSCSRPTTRPERSSCHRTNDYFATELVVDRWTLSGREYAVRFWRRPLDAILGALTDAGFAIDTRPRTAATARVPRALPGRVEQLARARVPARPRRGHGRVMRSNRNPAATTPNTTARSTDPGNPCRARLGTLVADRLDRRPDERDPVRDQPVAAAGGRDPQRADRHGRADTRDGSRSAWARRRGTRARRASSDRSRRRSPCPASVRPRAHPRRAYPPAGPVQRMRCAGDQRPVHEVEPAVDARDHRHVGGHAFERQHGGAPVGFVLARVVAGRIHGGSPPLGRRQLPAFRVLVDEHHAVDDDRRDAPRTRRTAP